MGQRISDKSIAKLPLPSSGWEITWDAEVKGFGLRVTAGGSRSFILRYRTRSGRGRLYTIGPAGDGGWKVTQARSRAKDIKARIRSEGYDPLGELEAERTQPTIADLAKRVLNDHASKKRRSTREAYQRAFDCHILPMLRHVAVKELQYADVERLHRKVTAENGPYQANRILAYLAKSYSLAIRWQWCTTNPTVGVERNAEQKRKRYLDGDEIARLTEALNKFPDQQAANVIRMALLTGARRGEILSARWNQFDFKAATWTKPGSTTKQKTDHHVPLSAPVLQLLNGIRASQKKQTTPFVFPGKVGHRVSITPEWQELRRAAGIPDVRIHDLRHSFASTLASSGVSLPLVGALLGHVNVATTARYSHLYLDAQRKAAETAASIIAPTHTAKIVKYPTAG